MANPLRRAGFYLALILVLFRFGFVHELLIYQLGGVDLHLLFIVNTLAIGTAILAGGVQRTWWAKPARWWAAFAFWLLLATLFSTWRGGSSLLLFSYLRNNIALLLVVAGLTLTAKELSRMVDAIALAGLLNVVVGSTLAHGAENGRIFLDFGALANSNDFAAHLLMIVPFVLYVVLTKPSIIAKMIGTGVILGSAYLGASTASRGALVASAALALFLLIRASGRVRLLTIVAVPIVGLLLVAVLPSSIKSRYATLFDKDAAARDIGAAQSLESREYLLRSSLQFTLDNPLFGVGPGEFADSEGLQARALGQRGHWQVSHNAYTQVSSEAGIPGLIFFVAALVSTFRLLGSVEKHCRNNEQLRTYRLAAFCMMASMVGFSTSILFLSLAYGYHMLFISALSIALSRVVQKEITQLKLQNTAPSPASATMPNRPLAGGNASTPTLQQPPLGIASRAPWKQSAGGRYTKPRP